MTGRTDIEELAAAERLFVSGVVPGDNGGSVALLSPDEPDFWAHFNASPEAQDAAPEPLDRWSSRVIGAMAVSLGGAALFPFGGPPWHPFPRWALASGRAWTAPVGLIVHGDMGLFASYRGAIALPSPLPMRSIRPSPCKDCARPCISACPVGAFEGGQYDVPRCKSHLDRPEGAICMSGGCLVRRACPVGQDRRLPAQSAFHMKAFHPDAA